MPLVIDDSAAGPGNTALLEYADVVTTSLTKWASDNTAIIAGLPARAKQMAPYVREGLRFGLREGTIEVIGGDGLRSQVETQRHVRKVAGDLGSLASEDEIRAKMREMSVEADRQIEAES